MKRDVRHIVEKKLLAAWPMDRWHDAAMLAAVSGGADSMALLRCLHALAPKEGGALHVAHFNHNLRGDDSRADAEFVATVSRSLGLPFHLGVWDAIPAGTRATVSEEAARHARYGFLRRTAEELGIRRVLTAHTADDYVETILINLLRGSALAGLAGIPFARHLGPAVIVVRPLLHVSRQEILDYLAQLGQDFRQDALNDHPAYLRNRIRTELLPAMRKLRPTVDQSILRLGHAAREAHQALETMAEELLDACLLVHDGDRLVLDTGLLAGRPRFLIAAMFRVAWHRQRWPQKGMGRRDWNRLGDMALVPTGSAPPRPIILPGGVRVARAGERLEIARQRHGQPYTAECY